LPDESNDLAEARAPARFEAQKYEVALDRAMLGRACQLAPSHQAVGCTRGALSAHPSSTVHGVVFQIFCWAPHPYPGDDAARRLPPRLFRSRRPI